MSTDPNAPSATLLVHDGELEDLRSLLRELGISFVERRGALHGEDRSAPWELVIATARRMLSLELESPPRSARIAILEDACHTASHTACESLRRAGVSIVVQRPVHPAALRAVVLHALYRGPERRLSARVSVGAPARLRRGFRRRSVILADLSVTGCRLLSDVPVPGGERFRLGVPAELAGGRAFSVPARVLRVGPTAAEPPGTFSVTAAFERVGPRLRAKLERAVARYLWGPASFEPASGRASDPQGSHDGAPRRPSRRRHPRRALDRRVIALGEEASRVLLGRDISLGGMLVQANPRLRVGEELRLAIQLVDREKPLVLRATVYRDDGPRGVVLRFLELSDEAKRYLGEAIEALPRVGCEDGQGYLVSEIVEAP